MGTNTLPFDFEVFTRRTETRDDDIDIDRLPKTAGSPIKYMISAASTGCCTPAKNIIGWKVSTQCVAAAGRSQEARFTFAYYKGNQP